MFVVCLYLDELTEKRGGHILTAGADGRASAYSIINGASLCILHHSHKMNSDCTILPKGMVITMAYIARHTR